ncbi:YqjK-like family protein [Providencia sneebia]|uniref:Cell division protein FtsH n=1 Tax=Providencia sneebia DSM 19967 TaxID=1141660 RepID=K8WUZ8_9GAMM|nr:YqjK-like family protein [Providencia sneebia]EKT60015.1 hypothetical protein OO7_04254 [Providencia sneebia DSM 19967]
MNGNKRQSLIDRKQFLINKIEQQRHELANASNDWLKVTEPYDRSWQFIVSLKPFFVAATGLISLYTLRHPKSVFSLGKKAFSAWGIARSIQRTIKTNK